MIDALPLFMRNPLAGSRVCQPPLPDQRQRLKPRFRDANAERMRNPLAGGLAGSRVCKAPLSYQRQRLKPRLGYANAERMRTRWRAGGLAGWRAGGLAGWRGQIFIG
jgi:hypothetical protein